MSERINFETITMEEYKTMKDFEIRYGIVRSKFGECLIGIHDEKICYMALFDKGKDNSAIDILQQDWPKAQLKEDTKGIQHFAEDIFPDNNNSSKANGDGDKAEDKEKTVDKKLNLLLRGTELQCNVWKELTKLKEGSTTNYEQIAKAVGNPRAYRAVASAIARNKIAYVIPCHRVITKNGALSKYRWGSARKDLILKSEAKDADLQP